MTFTYSSTSLSSTLAKVRLEIGDTDSTQDLFTDEELQIYIDVRGTSYLLAAADACDALAVRFARSYDFETDGQSFKRSQMSKAYQTMADSLRARASGVSTIVSTRVDGFSEDVAADDGAANGTVTVHQRYYRVGSLDALP